MRDIEQCSLLHVAFLLESVLVKDQDRIPRAIAFIRQRVGIDPIMDGFALEMEVKVTAFVLSEDKAE